MNTPEAVEWMLKNEFLKNTKSDPLTDVSFELFAEFIGRDGIFVLRHGQTKELKREHDMWFKQRKLASLIFTKKNFTNLMRETFEAKADILIDLLGKASSQNEKVDMQSKYFCFTMDSIQRIFFGRDVSTLKDGETDTFASSFDEAQRTLLSEIADAILPATLAR